MTPEIWGLIAGMALLLTAVLLVIERNNTMI